jgi:mRNA interferase RelE/StbE
MFGVSWEFELIFSPHALKDLKALDKNVQKRIKKATAKLEQYPPVADIIKLEGGTGTELRLRVGVWRFNWVLASVGGCFPLLKLRAS